MPPPPSDPAPGTGLLVVAWPIAEGDVAGLCERLQRVITASDANVVVCDVKDLPANCRVLEVLARLQLTARRLNRRIRLQRASPALQELVDFAGLADVIPTTARQPATSASTSTAPRTAGTAAPHRGSS